MDASSQHELNPSDAQRLRRNQRDRISIAAKKAAFNEQRRKTYNTEKDDRNAIRRAKWSVHQKSRRESVLTTRRNRFKAMVFPPLEEDTSNLQAVIAQRKHTLDTTREAIGVNVKHADPCVHCGAKLFAGESKGICCNNGKGVLPRLPPLPASLETLYTSPEPRAQKFRKESRAYNCKCNFASLNVEDGELKKMFGDHLLSVQGR